MSRSVVPLVAVSLLCALLGACAPLPPPPVCAQEEVLLLLAERLQRAGRAQLVEAGSVSQGAGSTPDRFRCAARVRTVGYDTERFGRVPVVTVGVVQYAVELRHNGVFLLPEEVGGAPAASP